MPETRAPEKGGEEKARASTKTTFLNAEANSVFFHVGPWCKKKRERGGES